MYNPKKTSKKETALTFIKSEQAERAIKELESSSFPIFENEKNILSFTEKIHKILTNKLEFIPRLLTQFNPSAFNLSIFRARPVEEYHDISNLSEHSYPPSYIVGMGRCNFPQHPVFYAADDALTTVCEIVKNNNLIGKEFCITKWKLRQTTPKILIETITHFTGQENDFYKIMKKDQTQKIKEIFKDQLNQDQIEAQEKILEYLHNQFISRDNYSVSASIAHQGLYCSNQKYRTDILIYPSIQTEFKGLNMAINTDFVDKNLVLDRLYVMKLESSIISDKIIKFSIDRYGLFLEDKIQWKYISPDDKFYKRILMEDFKKNIVESSEIILKKNQENY